MRSDNPIDLQDVLREEKEALAVSADPNARTSALCISGGGIRSATFGLGAIQGFAEHGLLDQFDYLSTVSGGGFVGGWLTAWITRVRGIANVIPHIVFGAPPPDANTPDPVQHLREYNGYMAPKSGALSSDLWTMIATVLRNILLNWAVLIPLIMAALMLPRLYLSLLAFPELDHGVVIFATVPPNYAAPELDVIARSFVVRIVVPLSSLLLFATALFNTLRYLPGIGGCSHTERDYILKILLPLVGTVLTFLLFDSLYFLGSNYEDQSSLLRVLIWTVTPCALAWFAFMLRDRRPAAEQLRLLFGPLPLAIAAMAAGIGFTTWLSINYLLFNADPHLAPSWSEYVTLGPPTILIGYSLGVVLFVGLTSRVLKDEDREWMARASAWVLLFCVAWAGACTMVLGVPRWALEWSTWAKGLMPIVAGAAAWLGTFSGSAASNVNPGAQSSGAKTRVLSIVASLAPLLFLLLLAGTLSVVTNVLLQYLHAITGQVLAMPDGTPVRWNEHYKMLTRSQPWLIAAVAAVLPAISWLMARFVNINTFSLHGMYRDRLVRAYMGASNPARHASPFTNFSDNDDMPMAALDASLRPLHVVNLTLNLVAGKRLAWQQRKAAPFTVTPLHCGSADLGYRPTATYGGGISLGTAVAISGAAASPNMGYHSSPVVGFIMTLFNARLGAWLGNPGTLGAKSWRQKGPRLAVRSLLREGLGQTTEDSAFVYLSDGGHFENLGLYEMVRRQCDPIVVLDSGCDPEFQFEDLGNALRKIRIDQRVAIDFDDVSMQALRERKQRWAIARIRYSLADGSIKDGRLVYIKPLMKGNEPVDVLSYAAKNASFPHQSTADQEFNESQTESYRALGNCTLEEMCQGWAGSLDDWCDHLERRLHEPTLDAPL